MIGVHLLDDDLAVAGIKKTTPDGVVVFHCLSNRYISSLSRAGVHTVARRDLARHSDSRLTDRYSKSFIPDQFDAVSRLPNPATAESAKSDKAAKQAKAG